MSGLGIKEREAHACGFLMPLSSLKNKTTELLEEMADPTTGPGGIQSEPGTSYSTRK